jgi:hypothetical protein
MRASVLSLAALSVLLLSPVMSLAQPATSSTPSAPTEPAATISGSWAWSCCRNHNYRGTLVISAVAPDGRFSAAYDDDSTVRDGRIAGDRISWTRHVLACGGGDQFWAGSIRRAGATLTIAGVWSGACSELRDGDDFTATRN